MKSLALIFTCAWVLWGCNNLNDLRPTGPDPAIPEEAVNVVKAKFPKAEELVFKPVMKDKIWEVRLKSEADRYISLVDYGKMWETYKIMPDGVPAALQASLEKTVFAAGTLSAYTTAFFATSANNKLVFNFKGDNYSFEWNTGGNASWATFDRSLYRLTTYDVVDLPAFVADTLRAIPTMKYVKGQTWVIMDDSRLYHVMGDTWNGQMSERISMLFNNDGRLVWSSTKFTELGVTGSSSNMQTVPAPIEDYLNSQDELKGFTYNLKLVSDYRGLTSYYISLSYANGRYDLYFDKDFNVVYKKCYMTFQ